MRIPQNCRKWSSMIFPLHIFLSDKSTSSWGRFDRLETWPYQARNSMAQIPTVKLAQKWGSEFLCVEQESQAPSAESELGKHAGKLQLFRLVCRFTQFVCWEKGQSLPGCICWLAVANWLRSCWAVGPILGCKLAWRAKWSPDDTMTFANHWGSPIGSSWDNQQGRIRSRASHSLCFVGSVMEPCDHSYCTWRWAAMSCCSTAKMRMTFCWWCFVGLSPVTSALSCWHVFPWTHQSMRHASFTCQFRRLAWDQELLIGGSRSKHDGYSHSLNSVGRRWFADPDGTNLSALNNDTISPVIQIMKDLGPSQSQHSKTSKGAQVFALCFSCCEGLVHPVLCPDQLYAWLPLSLSCRLQVDTLHTATTSHWQNIANSTNALCGTCGAVWPRPENISSGPTAVNGVTLQCNSKPMPRRIGDAQQADRWGVEHGWTSMIHCMFALESESGRPFVRNLSADRCSAKQLPVSEVS